MVSSFLRPFLASLLLSDCHSQKYGTIRTPEKKIKCEEKHNEFIFFVRRPTFNVVKTKTRSDLSASNSRTFKTRYPRSPHFT